MDTSSDTWHQALAPLGPRLADEVTRVIGDSGGPGGERLRVELERLPSRNAVYRVRARGERTARSLVVKELDPDVAHRTRLLADRWLPALGLPETAPRLLGVVAGAGVASVWHLYEDVGGVPLRDLGADPRAASATVEAVAHLHTRAAGHHVIAECRRSGEDFGMQYFDSNVADALDLLGAVQGPRVRMSSEDAALRDRLRRRLERLLDGAARRREVMERAAGPDTLLHGDLTAENVLVLGSPPGSSVRFIDWDHVGAGPACYDLSTLLFRFDRAERPWLLERYRTAVAGAGWQLPSTHDFNVLCDTCERARCANRIIWPVIALLHEQVDWAFAELREIERWFEALRPVLDGGGPTVG